MRSLLQRSAPLAPRCAGAVGVLPIAAVLCGGRLHPQRHAAAACRSVSIRSAGTTGTQRPGESYDALVVGLGAYGSAVLYHLAAAGLKVAGLEQHAPLGHARGSSHGASRIIRLAYFEGLQYGPLLTRSMRLFHELQEQLPAGEAPLFVSTGMLDIGAVFERSLRSARVQGLQHEVLTGAQLNARFPGFRVPDHWQALLQPDGGVLAPERIVQTHAALAQRLGAHVFTGEAVASWRATGSSSVAVTTSAGRSLSAATAVFAAGPWMAQLVPQLADLCVPERQVVGWFEIEAPARRHFAPDAFPVFLLEEPGGNSFYGFPEAPEQPGFKIGRYHHLREQLRGADAVDSVRRTADAADEAALRAGVAPYFPAAARGRMLDASACFFTNTPDGHFLIDRHPAHPQVVLVSACSGHGFKMCSGIGELVARMTAAGVGVEADLAPFTFTAAGRPGQYAEALAKLGQ